MQPGKTYAASAWVQGVDLHGKGFGRDPRDSAGLILVELDEQGATVREHDKMSIRDAGAYQRVEKEVTTAPATRRLRFILDTVIHCPYNEGHVTYDDCGLRLTRKP